MVMIVVLVRVVGHVQLLCAAFLLVWVLVEKFVLCLGGGSCCCDVQHPIAGIAVHSGSAWLVLLFNTSKALLHDSVMVQLDLLS